MAGELEQFITDCRDAIRLHEGEKAREVIKEKLSALTSNDNFVADYCGPEAEVGDFVVVHVGFAISRIDEEEAGRIFEALEQLGELGELEAIELDPGDSAGESKSPAP
jgi:hypothetical protein